MRAVAYPSLVPRQDDPFPLTGETVNKLREVSEKNKQSAPQQQLLTSVSELPARRPLTDYFNE